MNSDRRKTPAAARELNVPYTALVSLIRYGKVAAPQKDTSGDYIWTSTDIEAARRVLEARTLDRGQKR